MGATSPKHFAMTLDEIASSMGVTRERVYQIERRALRKLRRRYPSILSLLAATADELRAAREQRAWMNGAEEDDE